MSEENKTNPVPANTKSESRHPLAQIFYTAVTVLSWLVAIPLFLLLHKHLPNPEWAFHLDRIIIFLGVVGFTGFMLRLVHNLVVLAMLVSLMLLTVGSFTKSYGFIDLFRDYRDMVVAMYESPKPEKVIASRLVMYPRHKELMDAIDDNNPGLRDFVLLSVSKHFTEQQKYEDYRQLSQCFALFKEINLRWNYVNDPSHEDYYAKASESARYLAGDCDDYAILMAASIRSLGKTPRLIHAQGHLYPEMLIGTRRDMEKTNYLIKEVLFEKESKGKAIHFHVDEDGQIWLNMDYTEKFPGGKFLTDKNLGIIKL